VRFTCEIDCQRYSVLLGLPSVARHDPHVQLFCNTYEDHILARCGIDGIEGLLGFFPYKIARHLSTVPSSLWYFVKTPISESLPSRTPFNSTSKPYKTELSERMRPLLFRHFTTPSAFGIS
jgi:hypothetical protein